MSAKKRKWPKPVKQWIVPLYTGVVDFYTDREQFEQAMSFYEDAEVEPVGMGYSGMTTGYNNVDTGQRRYLFGVFDGRLRTAVHEMSHVALMVMKDVGIDPSSNNGEPFCYLLDAMWAHFEKVLCEHVVNHG
jgi:hypothetical protein